MSKSKRNRIGHNRKYQNLMVAVKCMTRDNTTYNTKCVHEKENNRYISRHHAIIHPNMYAKVKALAKAEGISDDEAYDRIMYEAAHYKTI